MTSVTSFVHYKALPIATTAGLGWALGIVHPIAGAVVGVCGLVGEKVSQYVCSKLPIDLKRHSIEAESLLGLVGGASVLSSLALPALGFSALPFTTSFLLICTAGKIADFFLHVFKHDQVGTDILQAALGTAHAAWTFAILTPGSAALIGGFSMLAIQILKGKKVGEWTSWPSLFVVTSLATKVIFKLSIKSALILGAAPIVSVLAFGSLLQEWGETLSSADKKFANIKRRFS